LLAIAARAGGPRFVDDDRIRAEWRTDRESLQALRLIVLTCMHDPDEKVRHAAVLAIGNMDLALDPATLRSTLTENVVDLFQLTFRTDPSGSVRTEIVKGIALSSNDSPGVRKLVEEAFDDPQPGVRQYAAVAAGRLQDPAFLERLIRQLRRDKAVTARVASAEAVVFYGPSVITYLDELKSILDAEADQTVRQTLARAINRLERRR
jgi:HEAT repeat protein